jgi:biotin carboxylase
VFEVEAHRPGGSSLGAGRVWEHDQDRAAAVGAALGVATHSPQTVRLVQDEHAMRARLREAGIDDTPAVRVTGEAELVGFGRLYGYPYVVEPVAGTASFGVSVVGNSHEAPAAYRRRPGSILE